MTESETLEEILKLAAGYFRLPRERLRPDDDFFVALRLDSLKALDLLSRLESHFEIELPDWEMQGVTDFRALASKIHARRG